MDVKKAKAAKLNSKFKGQEQKQASAGAGQQASLMEEALRKYPPSSRNFRQAEEPLPLKQGRGRAAYNKQGQRSSKMAKEPSCLEDGSWLDSYGPDSEILSAKGDLQRGSGRIPTELLKRQAPDSVLDLHNHYLAEAEPMLESFLQEALRANWTKVRIIHGKGHHNRVDGAPMRDMVLRNLRLAKSRKEIRTYYHPSEKEGGKGVCEVIF